MKTFLTYLAAWRSPAARALLVGRLHLGGAVLLFVAAPLLACSPAGINGLRSQVRIEVGKQFELGGGQLLGFRVEADNAGPVAVEIKEKTSDGRIKMKGTLLPGQKTTASFGLGSKAVLVNLGQREAKIEVNISGGAGLGMGYAPAQPSAGPTANSAPTGAARSRLSRLLIPAGQVFLLGGGQAGGFTFVGTNVGTVAVQARERTSTGQTLDRGLIVPGQAVKLQFGSGSQALLLNGSGIRARLRIDASLLNPSELNMTYRPGSR